LFTYSTERPRNSDLIPNKEIFSHHLVSIGTDRGAGQGKGGSWRGGEGGVELYVCPSVCVSPFLSVGAVWEGGFAFKVQIFRAVWEGGGPKTGVTPTDPEPEAQVADS
jgi:hypothetical protein